MGDMEPAAEARVRQLVTDAEQLLQTMGDGARVEADPKKDDAYHESVLQAVLENNQLRAQLDERDRQLRSLRRRRRRTVPVALTGLAYAALAFLVATTAARLDRGDGDGIAGALFTQSTQLASLDVFSFERSADLMLVLVIGGTGYLYGGLIGAVVFRMLQEVFSTITPQYWQFWIGLVLVVIVLIGRQRLHRWALWAPNLVIRLFGSGKTIAAIGGSDTP